MDSSRDKAPAGMLMALIFSLAFMQPPIPLLGFVAVPSDLLYLAMVACWAFLLLGRRAVLVWDRSYWFIALYFIGLLASLPSSEAPLQSLIKLVTQLYLFSLPILVCSLVRDEARLRRALMMWVAGTSVVAVAALLVLLIFAINPDAALIQPALSVKGTLPPGNYPRLQITFLNPNFACDYLTVSVALLFAARHLGWIGKTPFLLLLAGTLIAAATTISPGLGGVALVIGLWMWLLLGRSTAWARLFLTGGIAAALLFVVAMTVTPILHPTAPYLIHVPFTGQILAPSGRLMIWTDGFRHFLAKPLTGRGIGIDPVFVHYLNPSGELETSTDAHNLFLSIAAQCGIVGFGALMVLVAQIARRALPLTLDGRALTIRTGLAIGLAAAFLYEGLGGSFEDARHLWIALGLMLAAERMAKANGAAA